MGKPHWKIKRVKGQPIPGSKYFRDYCSGCGEAIRVTRPDGSNLCNDCSEISPGTVQPKLRNHVMRDRDE